MGIDATHRAAVEKVRAGGATLAIDLTDEICCFLVAVIVKDLGLDKQFPELNSATATYFRPDPPDQLKIAGVSFWPLLEKLFEANDETLTYFLCLASLHKARLKYARILQKQPIPTMDQVGPRGLLQYGLMTPKALTPFLLWRKWIFDVDNRAAQETGYLFEPIIAHSIGGTPFSSKKSPIRRSNGRRLGGRQVDCVMGRDAYEFKMRVTIAASGQGRWGEELEFPVDCKASGYKPILLVFDPTKNRKLAELKKAFLAAGGRVFIGEQAWKHLDQAAGATMAKFLDTYVRTPISELLKEAPNGSLPELRLRLDPEKVVIRIGTETVEIDRRGEDASLLEEDALPDDVDEELPGI